MACGYGSCVRRDDGEFVDWHLRTTNSDPAAHRARAAETNPSTTRGRRARRVKASPMNLKEIGPPAEKTQAAVTTGSARSSGIPCAMGYVLYVISPGTGCLAPVCDNACALRRPQHREARTTRFRRPPPARSSSRLPRPPLPAATHRDDRPKRPSSSQRDAFKYHLFLKWRNDAFLPEGLDRGHLLEAICRMSCFARRAPASS